jgi:DNA primase small subunit
MPKQRASTQTTHLEALLKEYYEKRISSIPEPQALERREFGFGFLDGNFTRHLAFSSSEDYFRFLQNKHPKDVYYSTALYQVPKEEMHKKGWLGAELVFDLDAEQVLRTGDDNIKNGWITIESYEEIKRRFFSLIEDFIESDFGLSEGEYSLGFSGGRGYHLRITRADYMSLDQRARREVTEYVVLGFRPDMTQKGELIAPFPNDFGWSKKIYDWIIDHGSRSLSDLGSLQKVSATRLINKMRRIKYPSKLVLTQIERGAFEVLSKMAVESVTISVDERVTVDINRLLRAPGTVHGGSGLVAKKISKSELERFMPFDDAEMGLNSVASIVVDRVPFAISIGGETVDPSDSGRLIEINSNLAYYLVIRGGAHFYA